MKSIFRAFFLVFAVLCCLSANAWEFKKVYIIRHGQRPSSGDPALTELGVFQARMAGTRLKAEGFSGKIYASPYLRTTETAVEIAKIVGGKVILCPLIQERTKHVGTPQIKKGKTQAELEERFPNFISPTPKLPDDWLYSDNAGEILEKRVREAIDEGMRADCDEFLLVGHRATVVTALGILLKNTGMELKLPVWNCTMAYFIIDKNGKAKFVEFGTGFIPPEKITSNYKPPLVPSQDQDADKNSSDKK